MSTELQRDSPGVEEHYQKTLDAIQTLVKLLEDPLAKPYWGRPTTHSAQSMETGSRIVVRWEPK